MKNAIADTFRPVRMLTTGTTTAAAILSHTQPRWRPMPRVTYTAAAAPATPDRVRLLSYVESCRVPHAGPVVSPVADTIDRIDSTTAAAILSGIRDQWDRVTYRVQTVPAIRRVVRSVPLSVSALDLPAFPWSVGYALPVLYVSPVSRHLYACHVYRLTGHRSARLTVKLSRGAAARTRARAAAVAALLTIPDRSIPAAVAAVHTVVDGGTMPDTIPAGVAAAVRAIKKVTTATVRGSVLPAIDAAAAEVQTQTAAGRYAEMVDTIDTAAAEGALTAGHLYDFGSAVARSVLKTAIDPARYSSGNVKKVTNFGMAENLVRAYRGIGRDLSIATGTETAMDAAYAVQYNKDGDAGTVVVDRRERDRLTALQSDTIGDGLDIVHDAIAAALAQTATRDMVPGWLTATMEKVTPALSIIADPADGVTLQTTETTPLKEIYRSVSAAIRGSKSVKASPLDLFSYVKLTDVVNGVNEYEDIVDSIYVKQDRRALLTGYEDQTATAADINGNRKIRDILSTADLTAQQEQILKYMVYGMTGNIPTGRVVQCIGKDVVDTFDTVDAAAREYGLTAADVLKVIDRKNATAAGFIWKWERKKGFESAPSEEQISIRLKVSGRTVKREMARIRVAFHAAGFAPAGWTPDMVKANTAAAVMQMTEAGAVVGTFESVSAAAKAVGVNKSNISRAIKNNTISAGFRWAMVGKAE